jgi:hypothetical protein
VVRGNCNHLYYSNLPKSSAVRIEGLLALQCCQLQLRQAVVRVLMQRKSLGVCQQSYGIPTTKSIPLSCIKPQSVADDAPLSTKAPEVSTFMSSNNRHLLLDLTSDALLSGCAANAAKKPWCMSAELWHTNNEINTVVVHKVPVCCR